MRKNRCFQHICVVVLLLVNVAVTRAATTTSISQNAANIGQYEKFEVTFTLSQTYSNPFDPCVIDASLIFHEPGGTAAMVPAFFYRDYATTESDPEMYSDPGPALWKARFAPSKTGRYTFDFIIIDAGGTAVRTNAGSFVCQKSSNKGFIRVDPNHRRFLRYDNGETRVNIGHNIAWVRGGVYGWNNYTTKMGAVGENWTRLWMCPYGGDGGVLLEGRHSDSEYFAGVGNLSMQTALRLDNFVETAQKNGVAIQLVFQHHGQFSTTTNSDWQVNPYNFVNAATDGGFLKTASDFFTDAKARTLTKNKYRYIVARWGYSSAIFAWELFNEVQFTDGWDLSRESVVRWHDEMSAYIRSIDHFRHPITTSSHGRGFKDIWNLPNIDLVQVHHYGNDTISYFQQTALSLASFNKPVIIGEFGTGRTAGITAPEARRRRLPEPYLTQINKALVLHNGIWSSFHVNSSAHLWWWDYIDRLNLYNEFTALAVYAANENLADYGLSPAQCDFSGGEVICASSIFNDFLNMDWLDINGYESVAGTGDILNSIGFAGRARAYIWIYDTGSQFGRTAHGVIHDQPVIVKGLDNGAYMVEVYATRGAGGVIASGPADSVSGILNYTLPDFSNDIAVKVRPRAHCWLK